MTTFQITGPAGRRRQRPRRMAAIRTLSASGTGGVCYPVTQADVDQQIICTGCKDPFRLGGFYAERPIAPDIAEIVCLSCAGRSQHAEQAPPLDQAPIVYGQDRNLPDPEGWISATIPVVVVEGMRTGDGRIIPADALSGHRALPIPLLSLSRTSEGGHLDATVCGRIDHLERVPGPDVINVDTGEPFPDGTFVWRSNEAYVDPDHPDYKLIYHGALSGLSVDLSDTDAEFVGDDDDPDAEPLLQLRAGRLAASTICTIPAFPGAHLVLDVSAPAPGASTPATAPIAASAAGPSIRYELDVPRGAVVASAVDGEALPPIEWFRNPGLTGKTPLTVTDDGRVYGHIAAWDTPHIGYAGEEVYPPHSHTDYAYFHVGAARVIGDDGTPLKISAGKLTMGTGHPGLGVTAQGTADHYDNTGTVVALVCAGEDEWGIWCSGQVLPGLDELSYRRFEICGLSGDWRPFRGLPEPELVAALSVPTQGFPIPRARVAAGRPVAIVAAGAIRPKKETEMAGPPPPTPPADEENPPIEPGTPVVIGDTGLSGVVSDVPGDTAIVAVEVPVADLTPADPPEGAEMASVMKTVAAMQSEIRTLRAQRVLDRV